MRGLELQSESWPTGRHDALAATTATMSNRYPVTQKSASRRGGKASFRAEPRGVCFAWRAGLPAVCPFAELAGTPDVVVGGRA